MIIFGMSARHKKLGEGDFYCPRCQARRRYEHKKATRYVSLYFIPLIPVGSLGEYIECQTCHTAFEMAVLNLKQPPPPPPTLAQLLNNVQFRLDRGAPIEYILRDLTAAGLDREVAMKTLEPYLTRGRKTCDTCGLSYNDTAISCASCGKMLK